MPRNRELIRQWTLLQSLATRRGCTIPTLAAELDVTTRTVRRDLNALQAAGFPIYDEEGDGAKIWRLNADTLLKALGRTSLTIPEVCALYHGRALIKGLASTGATEDLQGALDKIATALPPGMRRFLDRLPALLLAQPIRGRRRAVPADVSTRLLEAANARRVVSMRYESNESGRDKDYVVHPYRLVYAQGGLYLQAYVPAYGEMRTFLLNRIKRLTLDDDTFEPLAELSGEPFGKSMGAYSGPTITVKLRFAPRIAPHVRDRIWHDSQQLKDRPDGSVVMTLQVCDDYALRQWILGFGPNVRVLSPASLVGWIIDQLDTSREQYETGAFVVDSDAQPALPFLFGQIAGA